MEQAEHELCVLFQQLGLPSDPEAIEDFIRTHSPLPESVLISEAPFWTKAQRTLLSQALRDDADWAPLVDQLNVRMR